MRAMENWLRDSRCEYGPVFRKANLWGGIERGGCMRTALGLSCAGELKKLA
jgi:hypothetical protein